MLSHELTSFNETRSKLVYMYGPEYKKALDVAIKMSESHDAYIRKARKGEKFIGNGFSVGKYSYGEESTTDMIVLIPRKKTVYMTDGIKRCPVDGDYVWSSQIEKFVPGDHDSMPRLIFKAQEIEVE